MASVVFLQDDHCTLHGSVALALEVASNPLLNEHHKFCEDSVSLFLQELVVLILCNVVGGGGPMIINSDLGRVLSLSTVWWGTQHYSQSGVVRVASHRN